MAQIVIIEDNAQSARLVSKLLRNAGHQVTVAEDGEMGLIAVFENIPDLVLVDLGLPDIDGQTVIALMRQESSLNQSQFIAFTAWPPETARNMAKAYGCDGVITKPINTRTFVHEVETYLQAATPKTTLDAATPIPPAAASIPTVPAVNGNGSTHHDSLPTPKGDNPTPADPQLPATDTATPDPENPPAATTETPDHPDSPPNLAPDPKASTQNGSQSS